MRLINTRQHYGAIAKFFHWSMAAAVLFMLGLGLWMDTLPLNPAKFEWYHLHKSIGSLILLAALLRLSWRQTQTVPQLPDSMQWVERFAAHGTHYAFYALMLAMPLSGWAMSSAAGFPVSVFDWFTLPDLVQPDPKLKNTLEQAHEWMAFALMGLIALHIGAALAHHLIRKDTILIRMLPWIRVSTDR